MDICMYVCVCTDGLHHGQHGGSLGGRLSAPAGQLQGVQEEHSHEGLRDVDPLLSPLQQADVQALYRTTTAQRGYVYVCMYACMCVCSMHVCMFTCMYGSMCILFVYALLYICMYVCM